MNKDIKTLSHLTFRLELVKEVLKIYGKTLQPACIGRGRLSITPVRHFIEEIPPTKKKSVPANSVVRKMLLVQRLWCRIDLQSVL